MSTPVWLPDLEHELIQLMRLQALMNDPATFRQYPKFVRRAIDVAYAAHFRALLEFAHDGRKGVGTAVWTDLQWKDVVHAPSPYQWSDSTTARAYAKKRLRDADKLVGHLTTNRRGHQSNWGNPKDWALIWPMIADLLARPEGKLLTKTRRWARQLKLGA